jgi:hypothetical protein
MRAHWLRSIYRSVLKPDPFRKLTGSSRVLPDFLIIGAMRSGTTSLFRYLTQHPSVVKGIKKEVHYFDLYFDKGIHWYQAHFPLTRTIIKKKTSSSQNIITGEASPYYMFHPLCPKRVAESIPNVNLIMILRNPVDRAYSHYWHAIRNRFEKLPFEEAIKSESERLEGEQERILNNRNYASFSYQHLSYLKRGIYSEQIERWFNFFAPDQILIIIYESFFKDMQSNFRMVFDFLGISPFEITPRKTYNEASYPEMNPKLRRELIDYFQPHNERLYKILQQRLDWDNLEF